MFFCFTKSKFLSVHYTKSCFRTFLGWNRKKKVEVPFLIVRAKREDHPVIVDMLWKYYYPDEPTVAALGLGYKYNPIFDEEAYKDLAEGLSYIAKCKFTGDIVGACINRTTCPWDPALTDKMACSMSCPQMRQLLQFNAYVQRAPCLWERFCTNKIFEMGMLFVRREDRRRGVSTLLLQASLKLGADCGYTVLRCDATNVYMGRICNKLKMKLVNDIPYCSYTGNDPAHQPVFKAPLPHTNCLTYIDLPLYQY